MWLELQIFGFRALWSPFYMIFVAVLALVYFYLTGPGRRNDKEKATGFQQITFFSGLVLLYIVKGSPIDLMAHIMFAAHMTQMALYYLVFPFLIINGVPGEVWRRIFDRPVIRPFLKFITKPLLSLLLFSGFFSMYHVPAVFDFAKSNEIVHAGFSTTILFFAFCMWVSVFPPTEGVDRLGPLLKIGIIFGSGVLLTPACALIIFSDAPLYATYTQSGAWMDALSLCVPTGVLEGLAGSLNGPEFFTSMPLLQDQQLGGIIMKIMQEVIFAAIIGHIFFSWFNKERNTIDPIPEVTMEQNEYVQER
ncbi:cytochrome c oxidase assembly factor CtaG [Salimicrobium jeotgali]|uniref:Cytochrome c oxidase assembly factor CtaG n=1 Tax=Salimicrobium jeotgali TaxID=1230341 RepID=K2H824_9BACI|nr:cytochrome c oxidase assembly factor CtaG [Salimicrobium jeotgali]AKG04673.1 cytochrome c oxidase assembly factor CtaG [Salimicrobium jeotgali]EKE31830.1 cytochrome c oxidase assembly protein CtaG [Salimicrobium jeotgali]MBM7696207.1 putative membrane protein [Salimicrobium jeotgali]